ncbi:MAG: PAS domain-containing protein [Mariprofundaceae bacterium]
MRTNLPVTTIEHTFDENEAIVSKTDTQGRLTYCNSIFLNISGFAEEELLGEPHNIVRHPDMPSAAFADLWQTLQSGKEWNGMVKNRTKDGGFYWVDARATPSFDAGGNIVGYMSVRRKPSRDQISQAESLYAQMRASEGR